MFDIILPDTRPPAAAASLDTTRLATCIPAISFNKLKVSLPSIAVSFAFASLKSLPPNSSIALYSSR